MQIKKINVFQESKTIRVIEELGLNVFIFSFNPLEQGLEPSFPQVSHEHWMILLSCFQNVIAIALEGETDCQSTGYNIFPPGEGCGFNHNRSIKTKLVHLLLWYCKNLSTTILSATLREMSETSEWKKKILIALRRKKPIPPITGQTEK